MEELETTTRGKRMATARDPLLRAEDSEDRESFFERIIRPCASEFIGTMLFVFVGTLSATKNSVIIAALTHGFAIAVLVAATATISGGHVNPAVTLAIFSVDEISALKALLYFISQILGSLTGAALCRGVLDVDTYTNVSGGAIALGSNSTVGEAVLCEVLLTSMLVTVILLTAVDPINKTTLCPMVIGFSVVVAILVGSSVSGASMNPARSFGPAVVVSIYKSNVWDNHWIYWIGPPLGSLLAVIWYRFILASPSKRLFTSSH